VLIPNKHLETPHYRLERLKHDDERLASYRASYSLAEGPAEDSWYLNRKTEQPKARQEAVVKGITPDQPAPVHVPREVDPAPPKSVNHQGQQAPATSFTGSHAATSGSENQTGIIGRIMGWLRGKAANEAQAPRPAVATPEPTDERSRAPRNPRDSRESREPREPREPREGGRNGREPRDGGARREGRAANDSRRIETAGRAESAGRDPQVVREGAEGRGSRDGRGGRTGRQERPAGEARAPREDRPPRSRGPNAEGSALDGTAVDPASAVQSGVAPGIPAGVVSEARTDQPHQANPADDALHLTTDTEDTVESGEAAERRRRRRRRGGRRDRPEGERTDSESGLSTEGSEQGATVTETPTSEATSAEGLSVQPQDRPARAPRAPRSRRPIDSDVQDQESAAPAALQEAPAEPIASIEPTASIEPVASIEPIASLEPIASTEPIISPEQTAPIAPVESSAAAWNSVAEVPAEPGVIDIATPESSPAEAKPFTAEVNSPEPVTQAPQAPVVLTEIVANAGLEWVQTRSDLVVAEGASEAPTPRPARVRKPKVEIVAEPLQMVETKNDGPL